MSFAEHKQALEELLRTAMAAEPRLEGAIAWELKRNSWCGAKISIQAGDRSFEIDSHAKKAELRWDGGLVALTPVVPAQFGALLVDWLLDCCPPTKLNARHPEVEVFDVARFYEEGRPVEGEFLLSWDGIEGFYRGYLHLYEDLAFVLRFIANLRARGFDRTHSRQSSARQARGMTVQVPGKALLRMPSAALAARRTRVFMAGHKARQVHLRISSG